MNTGAVQSLLEKPAVQAYVARAHKRRLPAGSTIVHADDAPDILYLILDGSVSVLKEDARGREIVLAYLGAGAFFGEMCLFPEQATRTAAIRTRAPTLVAEMGYRAFLALRSEHPEILFEIAGQLAARLDETSRRFSDLAFLDVAGRVARALLSLAKSPEAKPHPRGALIQISRKELARFAGCTRESASRVMTQLEEDGAVVSQGREVLVVGQGRLLAGRRSAT